MGLPGMIQRAIAAFGGGSGGGGGGEGEGDGPTLQPDGVEAIQKATAKYAAGLASGGVKPVDIAKSSKPGANQAGWQQGGDDGGDGAVGGEGGATVTMTASFCPAVQCPEISQAK